MSSSSLARSALSTFFVGVSVRLYLPAVIVLNEIPSCLRRSYLPRERREGGPQRGPAFTHAPPRGHRKARALAQQHVLRLLYE